MAKLDWGRGIGLHFKNNNEYYETLGFLTKRSIKIGSELQSYKTGTMSSLNKRIELFKEGVENVIDER